MKKIAIIGCGNVASHLILAISDLKDSFSFVGCYGRRTIPPTGIEPYFNNLELLPKSDIYIVSVNDDAIEDVTEQLFYHIPSDSLVLHTSGTKSMDSINSRIEHKGVLYPLQTFSSDIPLDMKEIPFFIECLKEDDTNTTIQLARAIGKSATYANSERRKKIHIAAVFSCNFTNHMFSISQNILKTDELEFSILEPLIKECVRKALIADDISKQQTGPAIRHDYSTIKSHIDLLLGYDKKIEKIYEDITNSIINK